MKRVRSLFCFSVFSALLFSGCIKPAATAENSAVITENVQTITTRFDSRSYVPITVQVGTPVKWVIQMEQKDLNGCNNAISIPEYGIEQELAAGDTVVEFTPTQTGTVPYSCWMGMIRSKITVVDSLESGR